MLASFWALTFFWNAQPLVFNPILIVFHCRKSVPVITKLQQRPPPPPAKYPKPAPSQPVAAGSPHMSAGSPRVSTGAPRMSDSSSVKPGGLGFKRGPVPYSKTPESRYIVEVTHSNLQSNSPGMWTTLSKSCGSQYLHEQGVVSLFDYIINSGI